MFLVPKVNKPRLNRLLEERSFIQRKDIGYCAAYDDRTAAEVQKMFTLMQNDARRLPKYFHMLDRIYDDQTVYNDYTNRYFEPEQVAKAGNKLTNGGLTRLAEYQVGKSTRRFGFYAIGQNDTSVSVKDVGLYDEVSRIDILKNGGVLNNRGTTTFYSVFFPKTIASFTAKETAIFDGTDTDSTACLLRTVFPTIDQVVHTVNLNNISVGHVVYSGSV